MATKLLFVLLAVQLIPLSRAGLDNTTHGNFESKDGSKCLWFELRQKKTETIFTLACHCRSEDGEMQSFSCQYEGNLMECPAYEQDSRQVYEKMAKYISGEPFRYT